MIRGRLKLRYLLGEATCSIALSKTLTLLKCKTKIFPIHDQTNMVTKPLGVFSSETKWLNASLLFWGWIMWKMYNKTINEFGFHMISWIIKTLCLCYQPQPSASADNTDLGFDNSWYHAQPHPIILLFNNCINSCTLIS